MAAATQRKLYVTPANYLNFVRLYRDQFVEIKNKINSKRQKYQGGVTKLDEAKESVKTMSVELEKKSVEVRDLGKKCEKMVTEINSKTVVATEKQKEVSKQKEEISEQSTICKVKSDEAEYKLKQIEPILQNAKKALDALENSAI